MWLLYGVFVFPFVRMTVRASNNFGKKYIMFRLHPLFFDALRKLVWVEELPPQQINIIQILQNNITLKSIRLRTAINGTDTHRRKRRVPPRQIVVTKKSN